jgi:transposase
VSDAATARIRELEEKLARATHERDEYRKLYELVMLELERVKRHLRAQNKSEKVDAVQVQLAFAQVANLVVPPEMAARIANDENEELANRRVDERKSRSHGRGKLPDNLPRERIELHPPETLLTCACCGKKKHVIGDRHR